MSIVFGACNPPNQPDYHLWQPVDDEFFYTEVVCAFCGERIELINGNYAPMYGCKKNPACARGKEKS